MSQAKAFMIILASIGLAISVIIAVPAYVWPYVGALACFLALSTLVLSVLWAIAGAISDRSNGIVKNYV